MKIGIVESDHFSERAIRELADIGTVSFYSDDENLSGFISDKDAIFIRLKYKIDDALIKHAKCLKYICSPTTGLNHIDISNDEIEIISLKGDYAFLSSIRATPEHVFGLSIALLRNYHSAFLSKENCDWNRDRYRGEELYGTNVGIIGLGRIGKILVRYYSAFGATVYYYDTDEQKGDDRAIRVTSMDALISASDIVILSINYTPENERIITKKELSLLDGKYFINASRGEIIDEHALLEYVQTGNYKGIALDVLADEADGPALLEDLLAIEHQKNVIITPHIGGATFQSMTRTEERIVEKLREALNRRRA